MSTSEAYLLSMDIIADSWFFFFILSYLFYIYVVLYIYITSV
jgi:hypothetical protein